MPKRMIVFVPAILAVVVAAIASTSRSSRAADDDCLAKPSPAAPQGSHWYYRVDRASRRQCWFLAPANAKAQRVAPAKRPSAATPTPIPLRTAEVTPPTSADAAPPPSAAAPVEIAAGEMQPGLFAPRSDTPRSAVAIERAPASPGNTDADEPSTAPPEDDTSSVWPVLAQADLPAARQPSEPTLKSGNLLALLTGALALAIMIGCWSFERLIARRHRRDSDEARSDAATGAIDPRPHVSSAAAGSMAVAGRHEGVRKSTAAMRRTGVGRAARRPGDPDCDIEQSLRQLLHDWQRLAA
jgi:hypothetical protein